MNNKTPSVLLISLIAGNAIKIFEDMGIAYIASYLRKKGCDVSIMREALASIDIECFGSGKKTKRLPFIEEKCVFCRWLYSYT